MLADAQKRGLYDRFGHAGVTGAGAGAGFDPTIFADFSDIFSGLGDMFGFGDIFGGRRRRGGPQRGSDLRYDLEITFDESGEGTETSIVVPREETCETCTGSGAAPGTRPKPARSAGAAASCATSRASSPSRAPARTAAAPARRSRSRAPPAAAPAASTRAQAHGEDPGRHRDRPADAAATAKGSTAPPAALPAISTSSSTSRSTPSSIAKGTISTASCRSTSRPWRWAAAVKVPTLDGREDLNIPAGTQPGTRFRLRGKGMPNVSGRGHGDLHVIARVAVPKKLTKEQKQILEQLAQDDAGAGRRSAATEEKPFFERVKDMFG